MLTQPDAITDAEKWHGVPEGFPDYFNSHVTKGDWMLFFTGWKPAAENLMVRAQWCAWHKNNREFGLVCTLPEMEVLKYTKGDLFPINTKCDRESETYTIDGRAKLVEEGKNLLLSRLQC